MDERSEDARLVARAQCDDREALEALLLRVQRPLLRYIRGLVGAASAEDVLQDVFVTVWRNLRWLREPEVFRPWVFRVASRACYARLKRDRRWAKSAEPMEDVRAPDVSPSEILAGLDALIGRTSPGSRAVLLLHYVEDLSIEETAAVLDITVGAAKSRLTYGLSCLRELMQPKGPPK